MVQPTILQICKNKHSKKFLKIINKHFGENSKLKNV